MQSLLVDSLPTLQAVVGVAAVVLFVTARRRRWPAWLAALCLIGATVLIADAAVPVARWLFPEHDAGYVGTSRALVGTLFALIMGFVTVVVWQGIQETGATVAREANALASLERMSKGFPVRYRRQVQGAARAYLRLVVHEEWEAMRHAGSSERANAALIELWNVYTLMGPEERGNPLYSQSLGRLNELSDCRRQRLLAASKHVPRVLWLLLLADALAILLLTFALGLSGTLPEHLIVVTLVGTMTFAIFVVSELDSPFRGSISVRPTAFVAVLHNMQNLED